MALTKFTFTPENPVKTLGIVGNFLFYKSDLTGSTCETGMCNNDRYYTPEERTPDMHPIGMNYYAPMTLGEGGEWSIELELPAGLYQYRFAANVLLEQGEPDFRAGRFPVIGEGGKPFILGGSPEYFTDPSAPPLVPTATGAQQNSVRFVGDNRDQIWLPGLEKSKCGTVSYMSYEDIDGAPQSLGVYLPANFSLTETYPLILVSHGGGGNEADWYYQGGIHNIMDNLVADSKTPAAILVTMNNSVYQWDFAKIAKNVYECILPFVRKVLPVSTDVDKTAFCGLSMGSMTTLYMYMHANTAFKYFGAFSGGIAGGEHFSLEDPALFEKKLLIGCAEEDIAWNFREIGVPPTIDALKAKGVPHTTYFTPGSHDWYCWPLMFTEFASNYLWK